MMATPKVPQLFLFFPSLFLSFFLCLSLFLSSIFSSLFYLLSSLLFLSFFLFFYSHTKPQGGRGTPGRSSMSSGFFESEPLNVFLQIRDFKYFFFFFFSFSFSLFLFSLSLSFSFFSLSLLSNFIQIIFLSPLPLETKNRQK